MHINQQIFEMQYILFALICSSTVMKTPQIEFYYKMVILLSFSYILHKMSHESISVHRCPQDLHAVSVKCHLFFFWEFCSTLTPILRNINKLQERERTKHNSTAKIIHLSKLMSHIPISMLKSSQFLKK